FRHMMELDESRIITSIKSYHELSKAAENRPKILSDNNFLNMATLLLSEKRPRVVNRITAVMLTLTEREEDAVLLKEAKALRAAIGNASEQMFPPIVIHNLLTLASRIHISYDAIQRKESNRPIRRFVHHKSIEYSFIVAPMDEDMRMSIEKKSVATKGVISVSMDKDKRMVQLRVTPIVASQTIVNALFDCGAEKITRVVKNENGEEETWEMSREEIKLPVLPTYIEEVDASKEGSAVVASSNVKSNASWISSITSMFW
ncbi:hypothetical protein PFISCL1PPCAC_19830, partial [Pristionchus fissidentatus]